MVRDTSESRATGGPISGAHTFYVATHYKDFQLLWLGSFVAQAAQWLQILTLGWLVLELTEGNAFLTGSVAGVRFLPVLLISPWAGVLADRLDRRKLLMATQLVMAGAAMGFASLVLVSDVGSGEVSGPLRVWHPFAYSVIAGVAHSIIQPVRQAMVANVVPHQNLASAIALTNMAYPSTRIVGPALGGLLIATLGFTWNFFFEAGAYLLIVLLMVPMRLPYREEVSRTRVSAISSLKDGVRYVIRTRAIMQLIVMSFIPNLVFQPLVFVLPVFTNEVLNRGADAGGILAAAMGVGGITSATCIAALGFVFRKGIVTFAGLIGGCIFVLLFSQSEWYLVSIPLLAGLGFCNNMFRTGNGTLVQLLVPDELRGRVISIYMLDQGFVPLATLLISLLIHIWNPGDAFTAIASVCLVFAVLQAVAFREVRRLE